MIRLLRPLLAPHPRIWRAFLGTLAALLLLSPGIRAADEDDASAQNAAGEDAPAEETQKLLEGDDLRVAFPGAPNLDTVQKIRTDGKVSLPLVGEIKAAGFTVPEFQEILSKLYEKELVNNQVIVTVVASTFPVYISGAVLSPGEVRCDRPTTVLEAIMKAGGFDFQRARLDKVVVIRRGEKNVEINIKAVLEGRDKTLYFVKPSDVVMVPEKAFWF